MAVSPDVGEIPNCSSNQLEAAVPLLGSRQSVSLGYTAGAGPNPADLKLLNENIGSFERKIRSPRNQETRKESKLPLRVYYKSSNEFWNRAASVVAASSFVATTTTWYKVFCTR